ncbi:hypothetical protein J4E91_004874 [Alternaria rosae]|nr:hypothetical protein J4E91_004874 [Alternaria rosae]
MSSPEWGLDDDSPPFRLLFPYTRVDAEVGSTAQESIFVSDDDFKEGPPVERQSNKVQTISEPSEDDGPIAATRQRHNLRSSTRKATKPSPKKPAKETVKKPGPTPSKPRPVMKNDLKAKKVVIKGIESYWGKNWVRNYIPKCHRPLFKNGQIRIYTRAHENDPMKWLPSVLKAILMVAKLTKNRKWLTAAMTEVVRYRVKNTGNRKPQLATTDFDVMEDMLVKDWKVDFSFGIRYKHLLVNAKEIQGEEDVDRIMRASESEDDGEEGSDGGQDSSGGSDSESDDDVKQQHSGGASNGHQVMGGYHQPPALSPRGKEESPTPPHQPPPGKYRGYYSQPPIYQGGRPMMMPLQSGGSGGYGGYPGFNGYGYPPFGQPQFPNQGRQAARQPSVMYAPHQLSPMAPSPSMLGPERLGRHTPKIKRESPGLDGEQVDNFGNPGVFGHEGAIVDDAPMAEDEEGINAAMAVLEAELKLARLRAKKAMMAKK